MARASGVVTTVPAIAEARKLWNTVAGLDEFAPDDIRVVDQHGARDGGNVRAPQERMRERCLRFGVDAARVEQLVAAVAAAPPLTAVVMLRLVESCMADSAFRLVVVAAPERAPIPSVFLATVQEVFDREVRGDAPHDEFVSMPLARPSPGRLVRHLDRHLVAATVDRGDRAVPAWRAWRENNAIDHTAGFADIAPMLSENLRRHGVDDGELGRIDGIRRRAWYTNELLTRQAAGAVDGLQREGIDAVVVGELPAALRAREAGSVRAVRAIELCVQPEQAGPAADLLARHGWVAPDGGRITPRRIGTRTTQRLVRDPGIALLLHWQLLPQRCTRRVPLVADGDRSTLLLNDTPAVTLSPTAQLLRLWARTGDPHPGHQLRTVCDTADIVEWWSGEIDWSRLWADCARLGLDEYGETYVRELPPGEEFGGPR